VFVGIVLVISGQVRAEDDSILACNREMRKTFEAIQAWRRFHNGHYPGRIADLKAAGIMPVDGAICPEVLREEKGASPTHDGLTSRSIGSDPPGTYEYELSDKVEIQKAYIFLPDDANSITRQDIKVELLRRPYYWQVPILRCTSHRSMAPADYKGKDGAWRNLTTAGKVYWSGLYWADLWLNDVPFFARDVNVLFGLKGPPFHTDREPTLAQALDLRDWSCAFGDYVWWWYYPMFELSRENRQKSPALLPFFREKHGRVVNLDGTDWWVDGLVQLQGRLRIDGKESAFQASDRISFPWEKLGAPVGRKFKRASWLQGTVYAAKAGETAGWLLWHYSDGGTERVPIEYARDTARFWTYANRVEGGAGFVQPVWRFLESSEDVMVERWLRLYRQDWVNPRPDSEVKSLDFVSNRECRAAPFLIALNLIP